MSKKIKDSVDVRFVNPVTNKTSLIKFRQAQLDKIREIDSDNGIAVFSFFDTDYTKEYKVDLHIDRDNRVRFTTKEEVERAWL